MSRRGVIGISVGLLTVVAWSCGGRSQLDGELPPGITGGTGGDDTGGTTEPAVSVDPAVQTQRAA
jgi:hypothetical protein